MNTVTHAITDNYLDFKADIYRIAKQKLTEHPIVKEYLRRMDVMDYKLQKFKDIRDAKI